MGKRKLLSSLEERDCMHKLCTEKHVQSPEPVLQQVHQTCTLALQIACIPITI